MKPGLSLAVGLGALLMPLAVFAQEQKPAIFATYYYCNQATEARADTLWGEHVAPVFDQHLAAGDITAYGWLSHRIGGKWRRLEYFTSPSRDALLTTRAALIEELDGNDALDAFTEICPSHDDYIWNYEGGSDPSLGSRPEFGLSMYFECDFAREDLADEIYLNVFDDVLDDAVADGIISGWSWLSHDVGGKYRRIAVLDGAGEGVNALLDGRDAIFDTIGEMMEGAFLVFSETCNSHTDYVWNVEMSKP